MDPTQLVGDARHGAGQPPGDVAVAVLVVMPFTLTLVVLLGWVLPLPAGVAMALFGVTTVLAALWNAGWRARAGLVESGE
jgi:hypothetical protein